MMTPETDDDLEVYNPNQELAERRATAKRIRLIGDEIVATTQALLRPDNHRIDEILKELDDISRNLVKQTTEAAIAAKAYTQAADIVSRKAVILNQGPSGIGIDADELVSKVITFMRKAAGIADDENEELTLTQRHRRRPAMNRTVVSDDDDDDDEDGAAGDMLNWPHLGRYAAIPNTRRPALSGFLLGPLSVQKKARKTVIRTAPLRLRDMQEVRPEVLRAEDITKNEAGDLTAICAGVHKQLKQAQTSAHAALQKIVDDDDDADVEVEMEKLGIAASGNIDLVRFCINPKSFSQTVENLFYVSFLIRDSHVRVMFEENGLPSLATSANTDPTQVNTSKTETMKHQAVLSIDMALWMDLIKTFDIRKSMIEHRQEISQQGPGAKGWYG